MSRDRSTVLRLLSYCWLLTVIMPPNASAYSVLYNNEPSSSFRLSTFYQGGTGSSSGGSDGRKFGGYRIVPRSCKDLTAGAPYKNDGGGGNGTGVCMFNYECTQLGGSVVGSCVDVFLFGACCRLPAGAKLPYAAADQTTSATTAAAATTPGRRRPPPPSLQQPVADTILLHRNGTAVQGAYRPDDMSAELQMANHRVTTTPQSGWPDHRWSSDRPQTPSPVSKSTDSVPNVRKTTPSAVHHAAATTSKVHGYTDDYYDGMVLVPTLTVHDPNAKENNSISHILSILNQTPPADGDPLDASPSYQHAQQHHAGGSTPPAGLYTWGSIEGDATKTTGYGSPVTKPTQLHHQHHQYATPSYRPQQQQQQHYDRPGNGGYYGGGPATTSTTTATSTHHLPGPHFHVMSAATSTAKPTAVDPIAPTVIVLSPANGDKYPNNKYGSTTTSTTTATVYASSSSYRPPASHVKPSQSIVVTGKPSVSAAYTTTATYHHHHLHHGQQDLAFVPVSSTTLADHYYNANADAPSKPPAAIHTSSANYGHRPPSTTAPPPPPPTLSSTVHQDDGGNNNVFTTVITSVNHHHHKYQPTAAATSTVARPVLNGDFAGGGYRPHQTAVTYASADDGVYRPSPAVTAPPLVHITAADQPGPPPAYPDVDDGDDEGTAVTAFNSTDTFAFPPVRDPNVNLTAVVSTQQEKPAVDGGDYDADADPNPQLTADDNLDDKVHLFVEKVVQSLQGNFEDLERVLLSGDQSSSNVSAVLGDEQPIKRPAAAQATTTTTTTRKPPRPAAPGKPPAAAKPTKPPTAASGTYRPTPVTLPLDAAPYLELTTTKPRPTKPPPLLTPVQLFQPTTYAAKPPVKKPVKVTPSTTVVLDQLNVVHDHTTAEPDYRKVCGVRPLVRKNGRIVGGTGSTFGEWPWQVLVREATWLGLFTKNKCGGVLITQKHVITAAHCQPGFLANLVAVFGEYDISGEVESKRSVSKNVKRVIVHRQYDQSTFENDIALLELESPISYDQHIVPICMPDDDDDFTGRMASVTGWGRLKYGGGVPSVLQEVQVPIIENKVCQDMFETAGHSKAILNSFLCAGYANGQRDSCEGDSGGPLMIEKDNGRWTLIGTVSHGIKCAAPYLPGVYMRTTYYKPWLQTITGVQ